MNGKEANRIGPVPGCQTPRGAGGRPAAPEPDAIMSAVPFPRARRWSLRASTVLLTLVSGAAAHGQGLREQPLVFADGRVTVSGDVSGSLSCARADAIGRCGPDLGYFNFTDYDDSLFRLFRLNVAASVRASRRLSVLTEVRSDNLRHPQPYALYVRLRPWTTRRFDIQAGRIPPSFGAFSRRPYPADNLLIGYPLAYQYLTSLRPDALPATADELLRMRGRGWLSSFSVGDPSPHAGRPLIDGLSWDTGVQARLATDLLDAAVSVTTGTLAHPLVRDDNDGRQVSGRLALQPRPGLIAGVSWARGPFASRAAALGAGLSSADPAVTQATWGADAEYSHGYYLVRAEAVVSAFHVPAVGAPFIDAPLRAMAASIEGRYKLRPGLYAAARFDRVGFSEITGSSGRRSWEAPVWRIETGVGYSLRRTLLLKLAYQHNERDGGRVPVVSLGGAQLVYWF